MSAESASDRASVISGALTIGMVTGMSSEQAQPVCSRAHGAARAGQGAVIGLAALLLAGCVDQVDETAIVSADRCVRAHLVDSVTGNRVVGAEDLAIDRVGGRLFISAYDRRAVERAVGRNAFVVPEGGVYELPLAALDRFNGRLIAVDPVIDRSEAPGGLRPHGIDYDPIYGEVAFVNRGYQKIDGRWRLSVRLERVDVSGGAHHRPIQFAAMSVPGDATGQSPGASATSGSAPGANADATDWTPQMASAAPGLTFGALHVSAEQHCASNDLVSLSGETLVSFDHAGCGMRAAIEDVFGLARSGLAAEQGGPVFAGVQYANGVAQAVTGEIALAMTREKAVAFLRSAGSGFAEARRATTPGGPDNLTVGPDGSIYAAVHPSLAWIGAHRRLGLPRAPSRIVRIDPDTLDVRLVFEDLRGDHFPGASVAVDTGRKLVLGGVAADGLLVCDLPGAGD